MKKHILSILICAFVCSAVIADRAVYFYYDHAGNRKECSFVSPNSNRRRGVEKADSTTLISTDVFADITPKVYPNPTHGQLHIMLEGLPKGEEFKYIISSLGGEIVDFGESSECEVDTNLIDCQTGVYVLKINYRDKHVECKIIKI